MAHQYSNIEYRDMHFCYGRANGNAELARRYYMEAYPNRNLPHRQTFISVHRKLGELGSFQTNTDGKGRARTVRNVQQEERVINIIEENPSTSTRKIGTAEGISHSTAWRILHEAQLYPFHVQKVQALYEEDPPKRLEMCRRILQIQQHNNAFVKQILFTDESGFTRDGITNLRNTHQYAYENPHAFVETKHQHRFSLNVWAGIIENHLIGPYFFNGALNGETYLHFLQDVLPLLLEDVPLYIRANMWLLQDGAPPHFSLAVREYLNTAFPDRWIGRSGYLEWAPRSPDLNPMDFFLWGYLKELVYVRPVNDINDLRLRIINGCQTIRERVGIFHRVRRYFLKSVRRCIEENGAHFENHL